MALSKASKDIHVNKRESIKNLQRVHTMQTKQNSIDMQLQIWYVYSLQV